MPTMEAEMNPKLIVIDGKAYHNVEEMPPDVRQAYELAIQSLVDADDNHRLDALEHLRARHTVASTMRIIVDGKEYERIEDLPPDVRVKYDEAMRDMDSNRNGIPDFVEGMFSVTPQTTQVSSSLEPQTLLRPAPLPVTPTPTPDTSNGWMLALSGLFIFLLCAAGVVGIWYWFVR